MVKMEVKEASTTPTSEEVDNEVAQGYDSWSDNELDAELEGYDVGPTEYTEEEYAATEEALKRIIYDSSSEYSSHANGYNSSSDQSVGYNAYDSDSESD